MTAKEKVLEQAPSWTEAQATAVLAVVEAQRKLEAYFEAEAKLTPSELKAREDRRAEANAREMIAEPQVRELSEEGVGADGRRTGSQVPRDQRR